MRFKNEDGSQALQVRLYKYSEEGFLFVSECVPDAKSKIIYITSAYTNKKGNKGQVLNMDTKVSPQPTSEMVFDGNATSSSISNSEQKSNTFSEISSDEIHSYADDAVLARDPSDILRGVISQLVDPKAKTNDTNASEKDVLKQYGKYHRSLKIYQEMTPNIFYFSLVESSSDKLL